MITEPENFLETPSKVPTLVDLLRYRALHQPDFKVYTFLEDGEVESASLTYQELDRNARAIAAQLQSFLACGERALLLYPPGLEFIAAFFGCLYAGVVAVPAYPPRPNQSLSRLQAIVADAQPTLALTTTSIFSHLDRQSSQWTDLQTLGWLATDSIDDVSAQAWKEPVLKSEMLAFLQYTSGSTATPKGVMVSHGNILHNLNLIYQCFEHTPNSRGVIWLPLYHDMGLIGGVLEPLFGGFPVTLMSPMDFLQKPLRWLQAISRYKATTSGGPNFAYDLCVNKIKPEELATLDLSRWGVAFSGAEPVRAETLERFARTFAPCGFRREAFYPCYGMAETTLIVSGGLKTSPPIVRFVDRAALEKNQIVVASDQQIGNRAVVGVGRKWLDQKILIVDPEFLTPCPSHKVGEIWVSSPSVACGYWNSPEQTQQTFQAQLKHTGVSELGISLGPYLRTGDLGFLQDGELFVMGRLKDVIIIRGQNHYPQDIELTVQKSHPALRPNGGAAFAIEVTDEEQLVAVQEVERSYLRNLNVDEVVRDIRKAVSQQHGLQVYAVVLLKTASIPKTSSGKIQRYACRVGFLDGSLDVVGSWTANLQKVNLHQLQAEVENLWNQVQSSSQKEGLLHAPFTSENDFLGSRGPGQRNTGDEIASLNLQEEGSKKSEGDSRSLKSVPTQEAIETWLVSHLAMYLKVPLHEMDIREPFAAYGLDSSVAVSTTGELAEWLGLSLEPTLFWEYPNIEALAEHLVGQCQISHQASKVGV